MYALCPSPSSPGTSLSTTLSPDSSTCHCTPISQALSPRFLAKVVFNGNRQNSFSWASQSRTDVSFRNVSISSATLNDKVWYLEISFSRLFCLSLSLPPFLSLAVMTITSGHMRNATTVVAKCALRLSRANLPWNSGLTILRRNNYARENCQWRIAYSEISGEISNYISRKEKKNFAP